MSRVFVLSPEGIEAIRADPDKSDHFKAAATSFRAFLNYWQFVDQRTGKVRVLGKELWSGQEGFIDLTRTNPLLYALKARKLGYTTIECAYDAWVARFREGVPGKDGDGRNARVHLFSRRDDAAQGLLDNVYYGLVRLPTWMQLPMVKTTHEITLHGVENDTRLIKAYPANEDTAVEDTCVHGHVDEWARMGNPQRVWQAIEPTMAGSCHLITTGMGPANYSGQFWYRSKDGLTGFVPYFVPALSRPDRDEKWLAQKKGAMTEKEWRREYAMTEQDALYGDGELMFGDGDLDEANRLATGLEDAQDGHRYVKAWDIGRHRDAAVGICLDITREPHQVVDYVRLRGVPYPGIQSEVEKMHRVYPGLTAIERNSAGEAVIENLDPRVVPEKEVEGFYTGEKSKARILAGLQLEIENARLGFPKYGSCAQLDSEMRAYALPDKDLVQDSVMTLAIAVEHVGFVKTKGGKIRRVMQV